MVTYLTVLRRWRFHWQKDAIPGLFEEGRCNGVPKDVSLCCSLLLRHLKGWTANGKHLQQLFKHLPTVSQSFGYGCSFPSKHFPWKNLEKTPWKGRQHCSLHLGTPYCSTASTNFSITVLLLLMFDASRNVTSLLKPSIAPWITILHLKMKSRFVKYICRG